MNDETEVTTFYNADNFKAWITTRGGAVVDVDIVENRLSSAQRHEVITEYKKASRKAKQKTRMLFYDSDLLEGEP